ncbi:sodium:solute symporter [Sphingomonas aliaeris]|uniref:Sodium:solute symporter n=1 Tax=Sphingomonas aliaeris TaxID=2759526 RepID=A0A974NVJ1_9SPHN|nr:sodium:solute symporter [Sphingomonas aliaeris]QQV77731.1 sodium:solute symporter [Sphingomonas aliaeris]
MTPATILRWLAACLLAMCAMLAFPAAAAEGGVTVVRSHDGAKIAELPGSGLPVAVSIGGQPVAIRGGGAAVLRDDGRWQSLETDDLSAAIGGVTDGQRAALLFGSAQGVDRAALVAIDGDKLRVAQPFALPMRLTRPQAALLPDAFVIAGSASDGTPHILSRATTGGDWLAIAAWPGGGVPVALAARGSTMFLTVRGNGGDRQWRWTAKEGWLARTPAPAPVVAGSSRAIGQAYLLYLLGDGAQSTWYSYSTITDAWAPLGYSLAAGAATTPYRNGIVAVRADGTTSSAELELQRRPLGWLDWTIILVYLAGMLGIGFYFWQRSRMGSTSEFFLGSRSIPFWAAGISMFATNTSSISYLAVPAKAFDTDWQYLMSKIVTVVALMAVAFWVIPLFRRLNLVSVFSYLETRFHPAIRMLSSGLAILMHVGGRMGVVLFLPALAIGTITGTNVILCILVIGLCTIVYTALGGMKAVIWTDVFQVIVLMSGAIFAIGFIIHSIGFAQIYDTAMQFDKTKLVNVSFDFTTPTIWGFIILYTFDTVLTFPKDQVLMQRVLSTSSEKQASRSVWFFAVILLPAGILFYIIGTTLFAYYRANPGRLDPLLPIDAVFPSFIGTELPHGVTGIIIAGLFAAAMGTLSGTINSVATLLSVDFYEKLRRVPPTQKQAVRFAEWMTVLVGLVGVGIAIILSRMEIRSLLDLTIELFGLLGGSCAGAYTLGMFTRRANWQGTAIGIVAASLITLIAWIFALVHPYFYLAIAIVASIVIGYLASFLFPRRPLNSSTG